MAIRNAVSMVGILLGAALLAVGCSGSGGSSPSGGDPQPRDHRARRMANCSELVAYAQEVTALEAELTSRFASGSGAGAGGGDATEGIPPSSQDPASLGADRQFSTTNVQEEGVDEADFVKTDGDFFYVLSGGKFLILRAWPARELAELSRVGLEGDPVGLFLYRDVALVVSQVWDASALVLDPRPKSGPVTKLTILAVADRTAPKVVRELYYEGAYSAARLVGSRAHLVL
ncbi:MAG: beta-propeller domain-containing protein, partial [Deltaproteobacteria bacterium]|nr:beta-propeller domain-containing protein [Deltaproteobacteria bacterium]